MYGSKAHVLFKPILGSEKSLLLNWTPYRQWNSNPRRIPKKFLPDVVPVKMLKIDEPVSGSLEHGDMGHARRFKWDAESLNARGFLRYQKEYKPPKDVWVQVISLSRSTIQELSKWKEAEILKFEFSDSQIKYQFLSKVFAQLNHSIPNSMLYMVRTVGDVAKFYSTPVKTRSPFDELVKQQDDLPPNLHIQKEPVRFHPDTDTHFGGLTAFPKSSTIITGLRSKKKYKGFEAKRTWP